MMCFPTPIASSLPKISIPTNIPLNYFSYSYFGPHVGFFI